MKPKRLTRIQEQRKTGFLIFIWVSNYPARNNISQYDFQVDVVYLNTVLYPGRLDMKGNYIHNFLGIPLKLKALL